MSGIGDRLRALIGLGGSPGEKGPGAAPILIGDPAYDSWEVVRDFEDAETARAFLQTVEEDGIEAVLTSDWPLDRFGRGDIALRVRGEDWSRAEELLSGDSLD